MFTKTFLLILSFSPFLVFAQVPDSLTFSEVMFYQPQANCEFVEVYNYSLTDTISLVGLKFKYENSNTDSTTIFSGNTKLPPRRFAIIFEGDYDFENSYYNIPDTVTILKLVDNNFGSSGMSNSSDKTLRLISASGDTLSVYTYSANNSKGFSDEKIFPWQNINSNNWENSIYQNGTPGIKNSVTPFNYDLAIENVSLSSNFITAADTFFVHSTIINAGLNNVLNFNLRFYIDYNHDSTFSENEFFTNSDNFSLNINDTIVVFTQITIPDTGFFLILAKINFAEDENPRNDSSIISTRIYPRLPNFGEVCINEFKYFPLEGEPEWLEIFNNSDTSSFNLRNWRIADRVSSKILTENNFVIHPKEYIIIAKDDAILDFYPINSTIIYCNFPSLNNSGDLIRLIDSYGNIVDSIEYFASWNNSSEHSSLEKINSNLNVNDSTNWAGCKNPLTATPGVVNSISPKEYDLNLTNISYSPNNAHLNENINILFELKNEGLHNANFTAQLFYDADGDSVAEILLSDFSNEIESGDSLSYIFSDEITLNKEKFFTIKINYEEDLDTSNNFKSIQIYPSYSSKAIEINEILFAPQQGECEWVELVNNCSDTINLRNWSISDIFRTPTVRKISQNDYYLPPQQKLIIAKDSSLLDFHSNTDGDLITLDLPVLNNTRDGIVIKDANGNKIDSLQYSVNWLQINKRSLERKLLQNPTNDSTNWGTSVDEEFSTPWRKNSISPFPFDLEISSAKIDTQNISENEIPIEYLIKNVGFQNSNNATIMLYNDVNGDSLISENEFLKEFEIVSVNAFDSLNFQTTIENPRISLNLISVINYNEDENLMNNKYFNRILPNYTFGKIKINEIQYAPINGEPEWIEFQNCTNDTINIENFTISDVERTPRSTIIFHNQKLILPSDKFVITKDSSIYDYHAEIPSEVIVQKFSNLNNDNEGVFIKNAYGILLDSVFYNSNWGGTNGRSLERVSLFANSLDSTNWASSNDIELSTPGRKNSVTQKIHNLKIDTILFSPEFPTPEEKITLSSYVYNFGITQENNVKIFLEENFGITDSIVVNHIQPFDSTFISFTTSNSVGDSLIIKILVELPSDEDTIDNSASITVFSGVAHKSILITEFMAMPDSSGEWIELYNASGSTINLADLSIADSSFYSNPRQIVSEQTLINPKQYFVVCSDSNRFDKSYGNALFRKQVNFGSLNNYHDAIFLFDFRGNLIDSITYLNWNFQKNYSIEKINIDGENIFANWHISIDSLHSTPCKINSVNNLPQYEFQDVVINEIMFAPNENNSEFFEIYNRSSKQVQLGGFKFSENSFKDYLLVKEKFLLQPKHYFIITSDSNFLQYYDYSQSNYSILNKNISLGNDEDFIVIKDFHNNVIDSVYYSKSWHNPNFYNTNNRSLERINPEFNSNDSENWTSSVAEKKATPGKVNSVFENPQIMNNTFAITPNPFSPDNDGFEDITFIRYQLKNKVNLIRIRIFDSKGREVRNLIDDYPVGSKGEIIFDGRDNNGNPLPLGIYILFFEEISNGTTVNKIIKPVVIARKLN